VFPFAGEGPGFQAAGAVTGDAHCRLHTFAEVCGPVEQRSPASATGCDQGLEPTVAYTRNARLEAGAGSAGRAKQDLMARGLSWVVSSRRSPTGPRPGTTWMASASWRRRKAPSHPRWRGSMPTVVASTTCWCSLTRTGGVTTSTILEGPPLDGGSLSGRGAPTVTTGAVVSSFSGYGRLAFHGRGCDTGPTGGGAYDHPQPPVGPRVPAVPL